MSADVMNLTLGTADVCTVPYLAYNPSVTDAQITTAKRILSAAKLAGITRDDIKRHVRSVSMRQIDRYLTAPSEGASPVKIPDSVLAEVAEVTGISADYLLGLIPDPLPLVREDVRSPAGPVLPGNQRTAATTEDAPRTRASDQATSPE